MDWRSGYLHYFDREKVITVEQSNSAGKISSVCLSQIKYDWAQRRSAPQVFIQALSGAAAYEISDGLFSLK